MRTFRSAFSLALLATLMLAPSALAQSETLTMSLSRDWGYGGFGGDIQGTFSMHVKGPSNLTRVEFHIDDLIIGEDAQAPFDLQFVTDNYVLGGHDLYAVGYTADGKTLRSESAHRTFVPASESGQAALKFIIPLLVVIFGAMALAAVVPLLTGRKTVRLEPGARRSYTFGGGICPKCSRPFGFRLLGLNLLNGKFDRCPYCGRWSVVRLASAQELRAAEAAEAEAAQGSVREESPEDKLKKDLENSKFQEF
jgi:hypothetical protein